jgi:integrase
MKNSKTLGGYLDHVFFPSKSLGLKTKCAYRAAVAAMVKTFGRKACRVDLVTVDQIERFRDVRLRQGYAKSSVARQYWKLRDVMRHARPQDFPSKVGRWRRTQAGVAAPVDEPGTVWHHFLWSYKPERFDCSPASLRQMQDTLAAFFRYAGGAILLTDLTDQLLVEWAIALAGRGRKPNTIRGYVGRVETLWRDAHRKGLVSSPPIARRRKRTKQLPEAWTIEEFGQLIEATSHPDLAFKLSTGVEAGVFLRGLLMAAYDTGFRRGDLLGLRKSDLRADGVITILQGKTGLPITRAVRPKHQAAPLSADAGGDLLFEFRGWDTTFYELYRKLLASAGLAVHRRNQLQKIRRTTASYAELQRPGAAAKLLGHADPTMATKHYIDPRIAAVMPELPPDLLEGGAT